MEGDTAAFGETLKADAVATTFRDAVKLCLEAANAGNKEDHIKERGVGAVSSVISMPKEAFGSRPTKAK
jgi:hypothetical protein